MTGMSFIFCIEYSFHSVNVRHWNFEPFLGSGVQITTSERNFSHSLEKGKTLVSCTCLGDGSI